MAFMFAFLGFYFMNALYINSDDSDDLFCDTMYHCFFMFINYGIRPGGGIGDSIPETFFYSNQYVYKYIMDLTFFFAIKVILTNILFGILIDTFHELKEIEYRNHDDKKNVCYLCGLKRDLLEKNGKSFVYHCKKEHNIWNYLYFFIYLKDLQKEDMNGRESYILELVEKNDIGFFPQGKFISNTDK